MDGGAWKAAVHGVAEGRTRLSDFTFTFHFHALEKEMATHSSVLAWRIPGTGDPGGLPSIGSHRVGHDWRDLAAATAAKAGGEGDDRGWNGWMASLTRWMWVWVNSRSWWWTGRSSVLQFTGLQRVRHNWVTKLNWTDRFFNLKFFYCGKVYLTLNLTFFLSFLSVRMSGVKCIHIVCQMSHFNGPVRGHWVSRQDLSVLTVKLPTHL